MQRDIEKYKLVRRSHRWCVRVKGVINTTKTWHWCRERDMTYHKIKQHWNLLPRNRANVSWDYDFIFDKKEQAMMFIFGYL